MTAGIYSSEGGVSTGNAGSQDSNCTSNLKKTSKQQQQTASSDADVRFDSRMCITNGDSSCKHRITNRKVAISNNGHNGHNGNNGNNSHQSANTQEQQYRLAATALRQSSGSVVGTVFTILQDSNNNKIRKWQQHAKCHSTFVCTISWELEPVLA